MVDIGYMVFDGALKYDDISRSNYDRSSDARYLQDRKKSK